MPAKYLTDIPIILFGDSFSAEFAVLRDVTVLSRIENNSFLCVVKAGTKESQRLRDLSQFEPDDIDCSVQVIIPAGRIFKPVDPGEIPF